MALNKENFVNKRLSLDYIPKFIHQDEGNDQVNYLASPQTNQQMS